ncbi:MAG: hypothetical protein GKR93_04930 [Gammaproteobacteria bacterium]|nr:hypothetical protein [Gammaproteobacteria bacterium]
MTPATLVSTFLSYANKLKFRNLFFIVVSLFITDLLIPDFIPLIDEIILGLLAIVLANWKEERRNIEKKGSVIEGEIVDDEPIQKS